jgi:hypothetical protein
MPERATFRLGIDLGGTKLNTGTLNGNYTVDVPKGNAWHCHLWTYMDTRPIATVDLGLDG